MHLFDDLEDDGALDEAVAGIAAGPVRNGTLT